MSDILQLLGASEKKEERISAALLIRLLEALLGDREHQDERERRETEIRVRPRIQPLGG